MSKLYGLGAAVVLMGALFKLQHWPMAGLMLTVGMTTEVIIFFFSAFEPVHEELDWTLVYPELAGVETENGEGHPANQAPQRTAGGSPGYSGGNGGGYGPPAGGYSPPPGGGGGSLTKFDQMMENAEITPDLFNSLGEGLKKLNETTHNLNHVSDVSQATDQYVNNMQAASESINLLTDSYSKSKDALNQSIGKLSHVYQESADMIRQSGQETAQQMSQSGQSFVEKVNQSGQDLANSYKDIAELVKNDIVQGNSAYNEKIQELNKNLAALNDAYELQLKTTSEHAKNSQSIYGSMGQMMEDLQGSVDETRKYREEISKLNQHLTELNGVYGNMLSAMSVMSNNS